MAFVLLQIKFGQQILFKPEEIFRNRWPGFGARLLSSFAHFERFSATGTHERECNFSPKFSSVANKTHRGSLVESHGPLKSSLMGSFGNVKFRNN